MQENIEYKITHYYFIGGVDLTKISAHAGFNNTEPNSLESLKTAIDLNLEMIELDIIMYNGIPVLSHNKPTENEEPLKLCDALCLLQNSHITINCDAKEPDVIPFAIEEIKKYGFENKYFFTGCCCLETSEYKFFINIENIEELGSCIQIDDNQARQLLSIYSRYKTPQFLGFNINYRCLTDNAIKILIDSKIPVICWTIDDEDSLKKYLKYGLYAITTNNVSMAQNVLLGLNTD